MIWYQTCTHDEPKTKLFSIRCHWSKGEKMMKALWNDENLFDNFKKAKLEQFLDSAF